MRDTGKIVEPEPVPERRSDWQTAAESLAAQHRREKRAQAAAPRPPMPGHLIAYHLVIIQVSLVIVGVMTWAVATRHGIDWLNVPIAGLALYFALAAHNALGRGR